MSDVFIKHGLEIIGDEDFTTYSCVLTAPTWGLEFRMACHVDPHDDERAFGTWLERRASCCGAWDGVAGEAFLQGPPLSPHWSQFCDCGREWVGREARARGRDGFPWLTGGTEAKRSHLDSASIFALWCEDACGPLFGTLAFTELFAPLEEYILAFPAEAFEALSTEPLS